MTEEYRRRSDDVLNQMSTNIELILQEQRNHVEWQKKHEADDSKQFTALNEQMTRANNEILIGKTQAKTARWLLGGFFTFLTAILELIHWNFKK